MKRAAYTRFPSRFKIIQKCIMLLAIGGLAILMLIVRFSLREKPHKNQEINRNTSVTSDLDFNGVQMKEPVTASSELKTILIWAGVWRIHVPDGQEVFLQSNCEVKNCFITRNRSTLLESNAVLFHKSDLHPKDVKSGTVFPSLHLQQQIWIFVAHESPLHMVSRHMKHLNNVFNWTMTYRQNSDVHWPYGKVVPLTSEFQNRFRVRRREYNFATLPFEHKNLVAWLVSSCKSQSKRELFVNELIKYIPVDIYGSCGVYGNYTCPYNEPKEPNQFNIVRNMHDYYCHEMLEAKYKFYLSFENAFCEDYITEKVFNIMEYDIVPVVMGSANYSQMLPQKSFINVMDFESPKQLARYLKQLGNDENRYNEYLQWKHRYRVVMSQEALNETFCNLCKSLHTRNNSQAQVYRRLDKWFGTEQCKANEMDRLKNTGGW